MSNNFLYRHGYLLIQLLVLLGLLLLLCQPLAWDIVLPPQFWIKQALIFLFWVILFFLNIRVLVPQLLFRNRIGMFVLVTLAAVTAVMVLSMIADTWLNLPELMQRAFKPFDKVKAHGSGFYINPVLLLATLLVLGTSTSIKTVQKWQKDSEIKQLLEKQRISTELSFLKAQINPHFFFNTLHSIYALTMLTIETAREALHTLSRMMRYVLYDTQAGTTLLSKEIDFLQDYIDLMQLRLTDKVSITFERPSPLHDVPIAPMLFLPFVENAFKHGVSSLLASTIHIAIQQQGQKLQLEVRNTLLPEKRVVLEESSGIGLANTRRRLDLLYPEKYTLEIIEKTPENEYSIHLTLHLS